ncbi:alpha/beta fold hydrolase [Blautia sp. HCP3S3_G3]|uniref:alpha/beta fold hydrolase n=1 Tax=Blautia sp. HCP3S3_G3 TaxID=3438913 RepID=UPI003F8C3025
MYRKYESYFCSEADGLRISIMAMLPNEKPYRGVVQLVHGMSENKERYLPFMEYLAEKGYVTVIHDHRGHGRSVRNKRDLGYMYGGGADALLKDIGTVNSRIRETFPGLPLILFGHSMGSLAVRAFAAMHDDCMDMLIICGTPEENPFRPLGELIAGAEKKIFGPHHKSHLLEFMSFGTYVIPFRKEKNKNAWICSDPQVYKDYAESELCGFTFSDDAYLALFGLLKRAYDIRHWKCTNPKLPVLFISGAEDPCMGGVRKFASAVRKMRSAGYVDVKGKLYPHMRHEILNEKEKTTVYRDIVTYMRKKGF